MSKLADLASMLAKNGVITIGRKKAEAVAMYIAHATRNLQYKKKGRDNEETIWLGLTKTASLF